MLYAACCVPMPLGLPTVRHRGLGRAGLLARPLCVGWFMLRVDCYAVTQSPAHLGACMRKGMQRPHLMPLALGVCKVVALVVVQRETKLALISAERLLPTPPACGECRAAPSGTTP